MKPILERNLERYLVAAFGSLRFCLGTIPKKSKTVSRKRDVACPEAVGAWDSATTIRSARIRSTARPAGSAKCERAGTCAGLFDGKPTSWWRGFPGCWPPAGSTGRSMPTGFTFPVWGCSLLLSCYRYSARAGREMFSTYDSWRGRSCIARFSCLFWTLPSQPMARSIART